MWEICDLDDLSGNWHEVLFGGAAGVGAVGGGSDQSAAVGVPRVAARGPRQLAAERRHEVINGPADDGVVVHAHVHVDYANGVAHSFWFGFNYAIIVDLTHILSTFPETLVRGTSWRLLMLPSILIGLIEPAVEVDSIRRHHAICLRHQHLRLD